MRLLIDCDVLLDVALAREPFYTDSARLLDWAERHPGSTAIAWHTIANIFYMTGSKSRQFIKDLLIFCEVPATDTASMQFALACDMKDFEDAMQVAAAECFNAQLIVTRNIKDYRNSPIKALDPQGVMQLL
ncbi:MAG: PIN domain-containing protein [Verrucomicrobiales bacterium]|nr:PIN domain-containing protein [Verrucomicrobiales bacterium]